jgi:hypothetical protein
MSFDPQGMRRRKGVDYDDGVGGSIETSLQRRPVLVLFYMNGCSHCEANKPKWDEVKRKYKKIPVVEIESADVPASENVSGFPTMKFKPKHGRERVISGQQESSAEIIRNLGLNRRNTRHRSLRGGRYSTRRRLRN